jgi:hypothetical protein
MRFKWLALLFLASCSWAQGSFVSITIQTPTGQAIAGASIALCASQPTTATPCGSSSLQATYTDVTLGTACTLNPTILGPTSGTGCTNPGQTNGYGVATIYATSGFRFYQSYGQGIVVPDVEPILFPSIAGVGGLFSNTTCGSLDANGLTDATCAVASNPFAWLSTGNPGAPHAWNFYFQTDMKNVGANNPYGLQVNGTFEVPASGQVATSMWSRASTVTVAGGNSGTGAARADRLRTILTGNTSFAGTMIGQAFDIPIITAGSTLTGDIVGWFCDSPTIAGTLTGNANCWQGGGSQNNTVYLATGHAANGAAFAGSGVDVNLLCWGANGTGGILYVPNNCLSAGTGTPNGVITGNPGAFYFDRTPGAGAFWIKQSGSNTNTGWVLGATAGTGVTGSGTLQTIPVWTGSGTSLGNSSISDNGTTVETTEQFTVLPVGANTIGITTTMSPNTCTGTSSATFDIVAFPGGCEATQSSLGVPASTGGLNASVFGEVSSQSSSLSSPALAGVYGYAHSIGANNWLAGTVGYARVTGNTGSVANAFGVVGIGANTSGNGGQNSTLLGGVYGQLLTKNSTVVAPFGTAYYADSPSLGTTHVTNIYGFYMADQTTGGASNPTPHGFWQAPSTAPNLFSGNTAIGAHLNQVATGNFAGMCAMSSGTSCTVALAAAYSGTPGCLVTVQSATVIAGGCTVSGTTVTITAASSNSSTWAAFLFGNPN